MEGKGVGISAVALAPNLSQKVLVDLRQLGRGGLYCIVAAQYAAPEIEMSGGAVVGVVLVDKGADVVKEIPAQAAGLFIQNLPGQGQPQLSVLEGVADLGQMCRIPQNARK